MRSLLLKSTKKFIFSLFSLLFFIFCSIGMLHASDSEKENDVSFVIVKQVSKDEIKDRLKLAKLKKEYIEGKTDKVNKVTNIYYFESAKKEEKKPTKKAFFSTVASSGFCVAVKKAFSAFLNLFKRKQKPAPDLMKEELEKIQK